MKNIYERSTDRPSVMPEVSKATDITVLVSEHESELLRYASRLLRGREEARDAVQEAFIRLVRKLRESNPGTIENPRAWLYRTTRNYCFDYLRSKRVKCEIALEEDPAKFAGTADEPDRETAKTEETAMLRKIINQLEPRDREIIALKLEHRKSYKEIAEIMDLSVSNVGFILHNAMKKIRNRFKEEFPK